MATQPIDADLLSTVHGGFDLGGGGLGGLDLGNIHGGPSLPTDGKACTPGDPLGQRAAQYFTNPSPGGHGTGHGSGSHNPHLDPPVTIERPGPWRPTMQGPFGSAPRLPGRSDRRLKRRIRSL